MNWSDYRDAPAPGACLAPSDRVGEGEAATLTLGAFPVLLVRSGAGLRGFVNACPHQYLPLNHKSDRILSSNGAVLRCSNHSAGFDAATGEGVEGLGLGACLDAAPVRVRRGQIVIG